ncbi:hypothetical protein BCON_0621g00010 [Botryotinia convoluta]|uniref:glutamate decarboxylase n=1 Tax=Botryotinia convoluta TaxID=54673 RepID=A0A4Z1H4H4_9HELO|nr:hypothetical protein BCON_0621g00010 [Botryotinia convoluta]
MAPPVMPNTHLNQHVSDPTVMRDRILGHISNDIIAERNLGSFVCTSIDGPAQQLMLENYCKNLACAHEYPAIKDLEKRCVNMIANLWGSPETTDHIGAATTGSSESLFLAILALKRNWQSRNSHLSSSRRMNLIVGSHAHVAIHKAAENLDIEEKILHVSDASGYKFDSAQLEPALDEGTIGVVLILGNTYTGGFDPILEVASILDNYEGRTGVDIPIHVDAASGGFVAPFTGVSPSTWGFPIPRVVSVNASGHKFGMVSATVGWIIWRDLQNLPDRMKHSSAYLLGTSETFTMSYSQSSIGVVLQYYYLARLGQEGFKHYIMASFERAQLFSDLLEKTGCFRCINNAQFASPATMTGCERAVKQGIPLVAFYFNNWAKKRMPLLDEETLSRQLFQRGFSVPSCKLPMDGQCKSLMRVVVRPTTTGEILDALLEEILNILSSHGWVGSLEA